MSAVTQAPLISIVIPAYNASAFVEETIDSALAQTYSDVEVIVVNDGSTDDTLERVAKYGDKISVLTQRNQGLCGARNSGFRVAKGEVLLFLDSDDLIVPTFLEERMRMLDKHPNAGFCTGACVYVDAENRDLSYTVPQDYPEVIPGWRILCNPPMPPSGWLIRRQAIERCGPFDPMLRYVEDWDFAIRISRHFDIVFAPEVSLRYRVVPGSMSSKAVAMYDSAVAVAKKNAAYFRHRKLWYLTYSSVGELNLFLSVIRRHANDNRKSKTIGLMFNLALRYPKLFPLGFVLLGRMIRKGKSPFSALARGYK